MEDFFRRLFFIPNFVLEIFVGGLNKPRRQFQQ